MDFVSSSLNNVQLSRIGLGCGRLTGGASTRSSAKIVEAALACGITHFDVAPSYGLGLAEAVIGQILGSTKEFTIATKAGIPRPRSRLLKSFARELLKPAVRFAPWLKSRLVASVSEARLQDRFRADLIQASLFESLKELKRDYIDIFLLHEPLMHIEPSLQDLISGLVDAKKIGIYGVGTEAGLDAIPVFGSVAQYCWSTTGHSHTGDRRLHIQHGLLRHFLPRLGLFADSLAPEALMSFSNSLDLDLADVDRLGSLLLTLALSIDPEAVFLISSNNAARISGVTGSVRWDIIRSPAPAFMEARDAILRQLADQKFA